MSLFGRKKDPKHTITKATARVRDCQSALRKEKRQIDRHIFSVRDAEDKAKRTLRLLSKKGMADKCHDLAAAIVNSRRSLHRLETAKLNIDMVDRQLEQIRSDARLSGAIETSNEITTGMSDLVKVPEICKSMKKMGKELFKMGILEEKIDDITDVTASGTEDDDDIDLEINKILSETTLGENGRPSLAATRLLSVQVPVSRKQLTSRDHGRRSLSVVEKSTNGEDRKVRQGALLA